MSHRVSLTFVDTCFGREPICHKASAYRGKHNTERRGRTSMPGMESELTTPVLQRPRSLYRATFELRSSEEKYQQSRDFL